ncbi:MAG TPA: peptidoglycan-associated lipoprotein Pal [Candidatus Methylomirabilis sp.]|jgi:peptidoglycan-associated lipoprotein|nr:peptidoglycan-associated lipoprotein Pal [Candidatus Methylomirabilis sp.]
MRTQHTGWVGLLVAVLALSVGLLVSACATSPEVGQAQPSGVGATAPGAPRPAGPAAPPRVTEEPVRQPGAVAEQPMTPRPAAPAGAPLEDVFFDFDKAVLRDDAKASLTRNVAWLKANGGAAITIEGHADERGTNEYNLALGDRRAKAAQEYLAAAGIAANRIRIISYGEERPFVLGHDESAWRWNRRGHFAVQR